MSLQRLKVVGLMAVGFPLSVQLIYWLRRHFRHNSLLKEVLFFPADVVCLEQIFSPTTLLPCCCSLPHEKETSFSRLIRLILSVSSSLDVCVFAFSHHQLCRALLHLHKRMIRIRVLTDWEYSQITGSQIGCLQKAGISVRYDSDPSHMHNKFAVLDNRWVLTGSLNWTLTAVESNKENLLVTEDPDLVQPFVEEFQRLWEATDPALLK